MTPWFTALESLGELELAALVGRFGIGKKRSRSMEALLRERNASRSELERASHRALEQLARDERTRPLVVYFEELEQAPPAPAEVANEDSPRAILAAPSPDAVEVEELAVGPTEDAVPEPSEDAEAEPLPEELDASGALVEVQAADRALAEALAHCEEQDFSLMMALRQSRAAVSVALRELGQVVDSEAGTRHERPAVVADATDEVVRESGNALPWDVEAADAGDGTASTATAIRPARPAKESYIERRGRKENVVETARRRAMLDRVLAGELSNAEAALELGLSPGTWSNWKSYYSKRAGLSTRRRASSSEPTISLVPEAPRSRRSPLSENFEQRVAVLQRFRAGEITNAQAASELGLLRETWDAWKSSYTKRTGLTQEPPPPVIPHAADDGGALERLAARLHRLESHQNELERRLREQEARLELALQRLAPTSSS
ncbi:MAG: hypothetical protein JNM84_17115 [Planctomycetes bacterium]|nr:hypothetical protein [Planctomycetota bacterium]